VKSRVGAPPPLDRNRAAAVLILFAMLVFVFLAIAGLVIDMGVAHLTQAQMQVAADSAAIEGCRWRNFDEGPGFSNTEKRKNAVDIVRLTFDDDMHPTQGGYAPEGGSILPADDKDAYGFAAGPGLRVYGGTGDAHASATIGQQSEEDLAQLDDPRLGLNTQQNREWGDLVSGRYRPDRPHVEPANYAREDFEAAAAGTANVQALSFLVRLRRAGSENPNDNSPGVSTSLPRLPFLFAMGSTMQMDEDASGWNPRRDGVTVRATAIASARPAMRVGRPPCDESGAPIYDHEDVGPGTQYRERISGLMPFYIKKEAWIRHFSEVAWQASSNSNLGKVAVWSDGSIHLETGTPEFPSDVEVGWFMFSAGGDPCAAELGWPSMLGRPVVADAVTSPVRSFRFTKRKPAYIAIVEEIPALSGSVNRVVGYGFAHVWPVGYVQNEDPPAQYDGTSLFVISGGELIANFGVNCWLGQDNVSAHLNSAADTIVTPVLSADEWIAVLAANNNLAYDLPDGVTTPDPARIYDYTYIRRGTLLAPALTR